MGAVGPGFTKASDDLNGDWTQYRATSLPDATVERVTFTASPTAIYVMHAVGIGVR